MNFIITVLLNIVFTWSINDYIIIDTIEFKVVKKGNSDRKFIWLHGDEQTAKMALEHHINKYGGTAFFIMNNLRDVEFHGGLIDPNRIFSSYGAKRNIHKYNPHWSAIKKQQLLAHYLLHLILTSTYSYSLFLIKFDILPVCNSIHLDPIFLDKITSLIFGLIKRLVLIFL